MDCQQQQQQPTHYDAIILGTGLAESIVAASLARAGKQVLHIDRNAFYGEHGAAFDVRGLMRGVGLAGDEKEGGLGESYDAAEVWSGAGETTTTAEDDIAEIQAFLSANPTSTALLTTILPPPHTDITTYLTHPTASPRTLHALTTLTRLLTTSRQYTLDLSPKLLYARGPLVELLITSGVGKYLEFKALEQIWMGWEGAVEVVPGSKEDVFANKTVGLVEKRRLMKVLAGAAAWTEGEGREEYKTKPYIDYLRDQKLSPRLIAFVLNAIAFILETDQISSITTEDGLKATQRHLQSLGRWGKTAFLYTLYGAGSELAQAFCRMCAVYGGVYILDYPLSQIEIRESKDTPLSSEEKPTPRVRVHGADGTEFTADYLVASSSYLPHLLPQHTTPTRSTYRAISILDKSIHDASALNLTAVPPGTLGNGQGVCAVQGSWEVSACPRDKCTSL
ncbi:GDP dissociation inhibitor [Fimicolochytrium jonesii]|uniref:GDP dissociation inhibitor n=1 Tax=Fimicolochytrium jonesii TaxID=1396493 RepID=UPI0022FEB60D|nr:GDP dissociation inhibitor [Fimicolochytrium jonesii]KAI8816621.1 GDP dissociation inhibitor [Fimicolochytrium jonesii]